MNDSDTHPRSTIVSEPAGGWEGFVDFVVSIPGNLADVPPSIIGILGLIVTLVGVTFTVKNYRRNWNLASRQSAADPPRTERTSLAPPDPGPEDLSPERPLDPGVSMPTSGKKSQRIVLVYRRRAEPDETLLRLLERELTRAGHPYLHRSPPDHRGGMGRTDRPGDPPGRRGDSPAFGSVRPQ